MEIKNVSSSSLPQAFQPTHVDTLKSSGNGNSTVDKIVKLVLALGLLGFAGFILQLAIAPIGAAFAVYPITTTIICLLLLPAAIQLVFGIYAIALAVFGVVMASDL